jgi:hypothetical protein
MVQNEHLDPHALQEQTDAGSQAFVLLPGIFNDDRCLLHARLPHLSGSAGVFFPPPCPKRLSHRAGSG